jgi:hypothetical protein
MELADGFGVFDNPRADVEGSWGGTGGWSNGSGPDSCSSGAGCDGSGSGMLGPLVDCNMVPEGVVTVMTSDDCASEPTSMRYPIGRNVLNPWIRAGWP